MDFNLEKEQMEMDLNLERIDRIVQNRTKKEKSLKQRNFSPR